MRLPERIALVGFMGCGKSTVGRILADRLGFTLVDTDAEVEARAGETIENIFRERGEAAFREMESGVLASLKEVSRLVIAAGGGAPAQEKNRKFFARAARTFYLKVTLETARGRMKGGAVRPLLARGDAAAERLYENRLPMYERAGTAVETEGKIPEEVADEIIRLLENPRGSRPPGEKA